MKIGCNECEFLTDCEQRIVSKYSICRECHIKQEDVSITINSFAAKTMKYFWNNKSQYDGLL